MNILLVSNGLPPTGFGGVEVYTNDLAENLHRRGHRVAVFCRDTDYSKSDYGIVTDEVHGIRIFRLVNDHKNIRSLRETFSNSIVDAVFERIVAEIAPEVIHFNHLITLSARLPLIAARRRIPSIITLHDFWSICQRVHLVNWEGERCPGPKNGGDCQKCLYPTGYAIPPMPKAYQHTLAHRYELFEKALSLTQCLIVPSEFVRRIFSANGYPEEKIRIAPLGTTSIARPRKKSFTQQINFACVGTLIPLKGVDILIRAFRQVKNPVIRLNIYGREDLNPIYVKFLKQLADGDGRIVFWGSFQPGERTRVYEENDVVIIPSLADETFSMVAHEAVAQGIPVIASNVGALPEVIQDGSNGFLVEPGNVQSLVRILERVSSTDIHSELPGLGAKSMMSFTEHVRTIEQIYQQAVLDRKALVTA